MRLVVQNEIHWCCLLLGLIGGAATAATPIPADQRNAGAVKEVRIGTRTQANAAWWGFNAEDATEALQAAIDSGARKLIVPYMGKPWIIRPITLRSKLEIVCEPGVVVLAKKDEFKAASDSLFAAIDATDITLRGYGATLRMRKKDYQSEPYAKAEHRMGLSIRGCKRVTIEGLRIECTGGDGIYIGATDKHPWCEDVVIRNVICDENHRQGISVIGAENLLIENCVLSNTSGTPPQAGICLEPNAANQRLVNCVIRNCIMENNQGNAIHLFFKRFTNQSKPLSILFEDCYVPAAERSGFSIGAVRDDGPQGTIEFRNCVVENSRRAGVQVYDKSGDSVRVRFVNCDWRDPWIEAAPGAAGSRAAIVLSARDPKVTQKPGGIDFIDCRVFDAVDRPVLLVSKESLFGMHDLTGHITVHTPHEARMDLGPESKEIDLRIAKPME
jgi:polygalacturonase